MIRRAIVGPRAVIRPWDAGSIPASRRVRGVRFSRTGSGVLRGARGRGTLQAVIRRSRIRNRSGARSSNLSTCPIWESDS